MHYPRCMASSWLVRAGRGGVLVDDFLEQRRVSIDFWASEIGPSGLVDSRDMLEEKLRALRPSAKPGSTLAAARQLHRFLHDIGVGDRIVTADLGRRRYLVGKITSEPRYETELYTRAVEWMHSVPRDALTAESRNTLGAIQTLFRLNDSVVADLEAHAFPIDAVAIPAEAAATTAPSEEDEDDELIRQAPTRASEYIEDMLTKLGPYEMQDLVAGILRAMGYKTRVSSRGADRGVDIFASPDGLGLQEPRVFVEVKHRRSTQMRSDEIRAFLGGRKPGDRCLYVSTGGFSKDARYEADRSGIPLTLLDMPALRELLIEHYDKLDAETQVLVPLRRLYWPLADE